MSSRNPIIRRAEQQYQEQYTGPGFASVNNGGQNTGAQNSGAQGVGGQTPPPQVPGGQQNAAYAPGVQAQDLQAMYDAPAVAGPGGIAMTLNDVIMKTSLNFAILVVLAVVGWVTAESMPYLWIIGAIAGLVLGLVNAFKREVSPPLVMLYAAAQGLFLGAISSFYQAFGEANGFGNLVQTAVVGTFIVFAVMLTLYTTRIIKVTNKFARIMMVALISYLVFSVASVISMFFGVGQVDGVAFGFFGAGWIGIAFSAFAVILASFCLCLDFEAISQGIKYGVPERESWRMAFGLMVTLIWLYLEILRLLALLSGRE